MKRHRAGWHGCPPEAHGMAPESPDGELETVKEVMTTEGPKLYQSAESNHVV